MVSICVPDIYLRFVYRQEHREPALPYFLQRFDPRFNGEKVDLFSSDAGHNSEPFQSFSEPRQSLSASPKPLQSLQSLPTEPLQSLSRASTLPELSRASE